MVLASHLTWGLVIVYLENKDVWGCICLATEEGEISFCLLQPLSVFPVLYITFWFNMYAVMKAFSFSTTSVEKTPGLGNVVCSCFSSILNGTNGKNNGLT